MRASFLRCKRRFISDDLPTLERPEKAISGWPLVGKSAVRTAPIVNSAERNSISECSSSALELHLLLFVVESVDTFLDHLGCNLQ